ncbi:P-loop containing nucleoside triphosphate hydrolase protein [Exidia glandulosa HHB12029]|uniref:p-loop containing nucleoside triphosphate hydrolase protein n=1 Tax=Exidia glandulosa HHB12029 TaxID=1314781 RepID=A0A165K7H9_EXIGL|nr:P-loop containing nucleoside triphosphate hydrolase protein [Exidia glandulosa HHB12029]
MGYWKITDLCSPSAQPVYRTRRNVVVRTGPTDGLPSADVSRVQPASQAGNMDTSPLSSLMRDSSQEPAQRVAGRSSAPHTPGSWLDADDAPAPPLARRPKARVCKNAYNLSTPPVDPIDDAEVVARKKVNIMEDKSPDELQALITRCLSHRRLSATLKNPRSSRSHAMLTIWVKNRILPQLDDGLAGSEGYDDAKHPMRQLMDESRETNKSLMALKDCVRARARATEADTFVHVPYRTNKLTLLLKTLFDLESRQQPRTLVIAQVSPHMRDAHHSASRTGDAQEEALAVLTVRAP